MNRDELEQRYQQYRAQFDRGTMGREAFSAAVAALRFQDPQGVWWQIRESDGLWVRWDGKGWVTGTPIRPGTTGRPSPAGNAPQTLLDLVKMMIRGMVTGWLKNIPIMIGSIAAIWFIHTYLLVVINEGFNPDPNNPILSMILIVQGNVLAGALVWAFFGALAWSVFQHTKSGTLNAAVGRLGGTPAAMSASVQRAGTLALPLLLGCGGVALLCGVFLGNPLLCLQFILFLAGALVAREASLVSMAFRLGWSDYHRAMKPASPPSRFNDAWSNVGVSGAISGFIIALLLLIIIPENFRWIGYLVALIFIGLMVVLSRGRPHGTVPTLFSLFFLLPLAILLLITIVRADDGGISEATGPWIQSEGAGIAIAMGAPAAIGAAAGAGLAAAGENIPGTTPERPTELVLTDVLGKKHEYTLDPKTGEYINDLTGGQLDPTLWDEYNKNLPGNQQFIDEQRRKLETRDTAFDHEMDDLIKDQKEDAHKLDRLQKIRQDIIFGEPGTEPLWKGEGEPGDVITKINDMIGNLTDGKSRIDQSDYDKVKKVYGDAITGKIIGEDDIPTSNDILKETIGTGLLDSGKELVTGTNSDGSTSYKGMLGRALISIATGGGSEMVFTPLDSLKTFHDYVEKGGNSIVEGTLSAWKDVIEGAIYDKIGEKGSEIFDSLRPGKMGSGVRDSLEKGTENIVDNLPKTKKTHADLLNDIKNRQKTGNTYPGLPDPTFKPSGLPPKMDGMSLKDQKAIQTVCDQNGVKGYMRPTNPLPKDSPWIGNTHPKPELVKQKTVNAIDKDYLGFPPGNEGIASSKRPKDLPTTKPPDIPDKKWDEINKRYKERMDEFKDTMKHKDEMAQKGLKWDPDTGLVTDAKTGKPFSGDNDPFVFVDAVTGKPVSPFTNNKINQDLQKFGATIHNEHMNWNVPSDKTRIDSNVLGKHTEGVPGSEPLNVFNPLDQKPGQQASGWSSEWYTGKTQRDLSQCPGKLSFSQQSK